MKRLGILGSGATSVYLLYHMNRHADILRNKIEEICIFEKSDILGMGMPYSPKTTDIHNLSNIASEEIPGLPQTLIEWIECQDKGTCEDLQLPYGNANASEVYSRLALGRYLQVQFNTLLDSLRDKGFQIFLQPETEIIDIRQDKKTGQCRLFTKTGKEFLQDRVVIATGHFWEGADEPDRGYFASPWPIQKLIPEKGKYYNFPIGILGASLSAFDVVSSMARRHGRFVRNRHDNLTYLPHKGTENFKLCLHSVEGWLPHLQYEQEFPQRKIYRHVSREKLLSLRNPDGYLRLTVFFDEVCRPALKTAFAKNGNKKILESLDDPEFQFSEFAEAMIADHEYLDAFEGMKAEMNEAYDSVLGKQPIYWKEVTDDLMYCLNYHAELLPAEDHVLLQQKIMPFLMNVIAAMPLQSAELLLALHEADTVELIAGRVEVPERQEILGKTRINVHYMGECREVDYEYFIDCSGQQAVSWDEFPFPGLKSQGLVRPARAVFLAKEKVASVPEKHRERVDTEKENSYYRIGGIDIDPAFRVIGQDGAPNAAIHDLNFTHTLGVRPYAYGLQACNVNSAIVVASWVDEILTNKESSVTQEEIGRIYEEAGEL